jgi:HEAT repeat protein
MNKQERLVYDVFHKFQQARVEFVQGLAQLATRSVTVDLMQNAGVLHLLRPLMEDKVPAIQQTAALALGRLVSFSPAIADTVVCSDLLPSVVKGLSDPNRHNKRANSFVIRSIAKHSPDLARAVVDAGALKGLVAGLDDFDPSIKESSCWSISHISQHNASLAEAVVDAGAVPSLILCLREPEIPLKRIAVATLTDLAKHTPELAAVVTEENALTQLVPLVNHRDAKIRRQVCACLAHIAKQSVSLANIIIQTNVTPSLLERLNDRDFYVRRNAATCIRELARRTEPLTQTLVDAGVVNALIDFLNESEGDAVRLCLPGVMALGYVAGCNEGFSALAIDAGAVEVLGPLIALDGDGDAALEGVKAAAAWALGQIGGHSASQAHLLAANNVLRHLVAAFMLDASPTELRKKSKSALKKILAQITDVTYIEPLLSESPPEVQKYVLKQFAEVLPKDGQAAKNFVESGALELVQKMRQEAEPQLVEQIDRINAAFPPEIVNYYSPAYPDKLLEMLT